MAQILPADAKGCLARKSYDCKLIRLQGMDALQSKAGMTDRLFAFMMDVTSDASVQKGFAFVRKMLKESQKDLHALVSNAGILGNSAFDDFLRVNDYKQVAEVNTFGAIRVIHSFKVLLKSSRFVPFSFLPPILQDATVWFIRFIMRLPRPAIMENFNRSACVPDDNGIELNPTT
ncbi:Dehydrogenase/reductase SDR family member 9 [Toxocara canis]|uniref:Dehydrogenase/reductase SDR family member 9 n=1 Tax=Toxocara canis TaxID=6265 RepID=A0A0B2VS89_TOXCA|nr:Dehydrogenase/reductase SDR family member 9 [Toxocara canis]